MKNFYSVLFVSVLLCQVQSASAQVPVLNSYPYASAVLYIDFDGQTVNGTSWNTDGPLVLAASGLTPDKMMEVFNRVAEDYRPFNINVTTDSTKYWAAPAQQRIRMILTTTSDWYGSAGGVAFVNSFTWGDNTPAFVFTALLGYNGKNIGEATSHEAGHTFGLRHQAAYDNYCNKVSEYNSGVGSGEIGWAPIMGVGYGRNLTLWNNGANPLGCSNIQDDLGIITSAQNGFGYRNDDYADETYAATPVFFTGNEFSAEGIIERNNDVDMIRFNIPVKGEVKLNAVPYHVAAGNSGSNLDLQVELLNSYGETVGTYNPATLLSSGFDTTLNAGSYYVRVRGMGNMYAPEYASLGSYTVDAAYTVTSTLPLHKLELKGITEKGNHNFNWDIVADENIVSQNMEVSTDGISFTRLDAAQPASRSFSYAPEKAGTYYYRLQVTFDDDRTYYSNVVMLRAQGLVGNPALVGNIIRSDLKVNSPANYTFAVVDMNGRMVKKGTLSQGMNNITVSNLTAGMYIIQYLGEGRQSAERFMKQ